MTARILAAATGVRGIVNYFFDPCIHGMLQFADNASELASGQTVIACWAGRIGLFKPTEGFVDGFFTVRTSEVYFRI